jgi:hypothetical protein
MTTQSQRISNPLLVIIVVLIIVILVLQVYMLTEIHRPILRPVPKAPTPSFKLPGSWYEKYRNPEAENVYSSV